MSLDVIFKSLASTIRPPDGSISPLLLSTVAASDISESQMFTAQTFLEAVYGDPADRGRNSRAQTPMSTGRANTPMTVWYPPPKNPLHGTARFPPLVTTCTGPYSKIYSGSPSRSSYINPSIMHPNLRERMKQQSSAQPSPGEEHRANTLFRTIQEPMPAIIFPRRNVPQRPGNLPRSPDVSHLTMELNPHSEYVVLVSMYEVYNDRIFDLLSPAVAPGQGSTMSRQGGTAQKDRRKALFFKSTEGSPDRKVVAGLRKIACSTYDEALSVLEVGLTERKVTGTGANSVSSRSHGFFCLEVKRRMRNKRTGEEMWIGNTLTVADLAGE